LTIKSTMSLTAIMGSCRTAAVITQRVHLEAMILYFSLLLSEPIASGHDKYLVERRDARMETPDVLCFQFFPTALDVCFKNAIELSLLESSNIKLEY
jgi:hypothetical protein